MEAPRKPGSFAGVCPFTQVRVLELCFLIHIFRASTFKFANASAHGEISSATATACLRWISSKNSKSLHFGC